MLKHIPNFTGFYASTKGLIFKLTKEVPQRINKVNGYSYVDLKVDGKLYTRSVHRLIALAFYENPLNKPCACPRDNNKKNNQYKNIYWGTRSQNMKDKLKHGTQFFGDTHPMAKLSNNQVKDIYKLRNCPITQTEVSLKFGVTSQHVWAIQNGRRCSKITGAKYEK